MSNCLKPESPTRSEVPGICTPRRFGLAFATVAAVFAIGIKAPVADQQETSALTKPALGECRYFKAWWTTRKLAGERDLSVGTL